MSSSGDPMWVGSGNFTAAAQARWCAHTIRAMSSFTVMGVVNLTPDSFSDGGRWLDTRAAIEHGRVLAAEGAQILDIGGESTRPGAEPVGAAEELRRTLPVVEQLAADGHTVSIDTSKLKVAREAVRGGARYVNDVTAFRQDPGMAALVAEPAARAA